MQTRCYNCNKPHQSTYSNFFCEECLPENRLLFFPIQDKAAARPPVFTRVLTYIAILTTTYCIIETIRFILK